MYLPKPIFTTFTLTFLTALVAAMTPQFTYPLTTPHDEHYTAQIRKNLNIFHKNLSIANYTAIGTLLSPDYYWNYDGTILITRQAGAAALEYFVESALHGLEGRDIYNLIDGNRGAVLFRISGKQSGDFLGLPLQKEGRYNVRSAEHFIFNGDAEAREVVTVTPTRVMKKQMTGEIEVPYVCSNVSLKVNPQTNLGFRELIRKNMAALHLNVMAGDADKNAVFATEDVEVDENGDVSRGREAFVGLVAARNVGLGSFPEKAFHDFDVLADGKLGAISYIWQGAQKEKYIDVPLKEGAIVRMRGMLFFEFNDNGLIEKAFSVYDEGVVSNTLTGTGGYLYP